LILPMVVILAGTARGQGLMEVVGNLGASAAATGSTQMLSNKTFAQQFTTGIVNPWDTDEDGRVLHQFIMDLNPTYGFDPDAGDGGGFVPLDAVFQWTLRSDNAGNPGNELVAARDFTVSAPGLHTIGYAAMFWEYILQSNTTYWLTVKYRYTGGSFAAATPALLPVTTETAMTGTGSLGALMENTGSGWTGLSEKAVLQVQVESVPEPGSGALLGMGVVYFLVRRAKRKG
jgi:hypothetical protein